MCILNISRLLEESVVDGEGVRFVVFSQGCDKHPHCKNCHNPQTWPKEGGTMIPIDDIVNKVKENPLLDGVTFSGGEPFDQPKAFAELAKKIHALGLNVWSFSGWTLEELKGRHDPDIDELLSNIDVLVDGRFEEDKKDLNLEFRGSSNQRIIKF